LPACSFPMLRRPPTSPLFPYTTLFRSYGYQVMFPPPPDATQKAAQASKAATAPNASAPAPANPGPAAGLPAASNTAPAREVVVEDRKSTRLNSSHVAISYAVFCLKKKT